MPALEIITIGLSAGSLLMLGVLVLRRLQLARHDQGRRALEARLTPVALELIATGAQPPSHLDVREKGVLADLLGRYARTVSGPTHQRIVEFFEREGTVDRELAMMSHGRQAWRRATAAFRLGDIGPESAAPALVEALTDPSRDVRIAAVRSLGHLRAPAAVEPLLRVAADHRVPDALVGWALLQIGSPALPTLRQLTDHPDPRARAAAVQLIGLLGGAADAELVAAGLHDTSAEVREQAALALARIGTGRQLAGLVERLDDRVAAVREAAAMALGQLRDDRSVGALLAHIDADAFEVARAAAQALTAVVPAAAAELARTRESPHLREAVALASVR